jgi:hypothetical protein
MADNTQRHPVRQELKPAGLAPKQPRIQPLHRKARNTSNSVSRGYSRTSRVGKNLTQGITGGHGVLAGEMIFGFVIIFLRSIADYTPGSDPSTAGTEAPSKGASPMLLAAANIAVFFFLAIVANINSGWNKVANAFGALVVVALLFNSATELQAVETWISNANSGTTTTDGLTSTAVPVNNSAADQNAATSALAGITGLSGLVNGGGTTATTTPTTGTPGTPSAIPLIPSSLLPGSSSGQTVNINGKNVPISDIPTVSPTVLAG